MTAFSLLSVDLRLIFAAILFIATLSELALCIYQYVCTHRIRHCIKDAIVFVQLLLMLSLITAEAGPDVVGDIIKLPWLIVPAISIAVFVRVVFGFRRERTRAKRALTPFAVKQALDKLKDGICFANSDGRLVLMNQRMETLARDLVGRYPKSMKELESAATSRSGYFRSSDGREWTFKFSALDEEFTQMTAVCITEGKYE